MGQPNRLLVSRFTPLAAYLAAAFALAPSATSAAVNTVANCNDSGTGSLRKVVGASVSGDIVDMSGLKVSDPGCSAGRITLTTGEIQINVNSLGMKGPGATKLAISGDDSGSIEKHRILDHQAPGADGSLSITGLTIRDGYLVSKTGDAKGGCIYSNASVELADVVLTNCVAKGIASHRTLGGAIYSQGLLALNSSTITGNSVTPSGASASGGGAYAGASLIAKYSTFSNNTAGNVSGVSACGDVSVGYSTISGNYSVVGPAVGLVCGGASDPGTATIYNSTISGNGVHDGPTGILSVAPLVLKNSTVAYNVAAAQTMPGNYYDAGITMAPGSRTLVLQSSIIASNTVAGKESDLYTETLAKVDVSGANNLIIVSNQALPTDTLHTCPQLGPLRDNGGATMTHALLSHSPAIDAGNNTAKSDFDQRFTGYPRVSGIAADIGAYEVQQDDIIFNNGFDGCP